MSIFERRNFYALLLISSFSLSFPSANGLYCHVCRSDNLEQCSTFNSPNAEELPTELCPTDVTSCFTKIENGITIRGCMTRQIQSQCGNDSCASCKSNKCNANIFPEDRLSCLHCEGSDCVNQRNTVEVRYPCANYQPNDSCYSVFSNDGSVAYRGCLSDYGSDGRDYCIQNFAQCHICPNRACNSNPLEFEEKLSCVKCEPDENSNCNVIDENLKATECAATPLGYQNECYIYRNGSQSRRGCLYEAPERVFNDCSDVFSATCTICNQSDCNRTPIVNTDLTFNAFQFENTHEEVKYCHSCNSSDPACGESLQLNNDFRKQCTSDANLSGCYHLINGDYVERGCLTDLKGDKREDCISDSEHCKTCSESDCNDASNFTRCFFSDHADYIGHSKMCRKYKDSCIIHANGEMVRRGCLHDWNFDPPIGLDINDDCENKPTVCEKCYTPNCNDRFLGREHCLFCLPSDGITCKHYPTNKMRVMCPFSVQKIGCYHRQDSTINVTRGCTSSLDSLELQECLSTNSTCKTCLGDSCNNKIEFQTCVACSSEIDGEDCKSNTILLNERQCLNYSDQCYIQLENDVVTRNCTDHITYNDYHMNSNYTLCTGTRCNGRIIQPESCITCDSDKNEACASAAVRKEKLFIQKCPLSFEEEGCFHYMHRTGSRHIRGCVSKLPNMDVLQDSSNRWQEFRTCKGPNCNSAQLLPKCIVCDSSEDFNCASSPNLRHSKVCDQYKNECFTLISARNVVRGCLADLDENEKRECESNKQKCEVYPAIDIIGLNNNSVNADDTCIECDSKTNNTCRFEPELFKGKICDRIDASTEKGCYLSIKGDHVTRGCIQDLKPAVAKECRSNSDTCKMCTEKDCNSKQKFNECYSCNSRSDPFCARNVRLTNTEICKSYHSNCVTGIDRNGFIHRQCADKNTNYANQFPKQFELCEGDKCNSKVYPPEVLQCIQCTGDDKKCDMMDNKLAVAEPCSTSSAYDQCFTYIGKDKKIFRGCLSDASDERLLCERVNEHKNGSCVKCNTTGCNNQPKIEKPTLSCMNCTGSQECAFGLISLNASVPCKRPVLFGDKETCYTQSTDGINVARGCTLDATYNGLAEDWCKEEYGCITCAENNCNHQNGRFSKCVRCEGDLRSDCAAGPKLIDYIGQCDRSPYPYSKRGCYTFVRNATVSRGCISDLSDAEYDHNFQQKTFVLCTDDNCNKEDINSSSKTSASILICSIAVLLAYTLQY